MLQLANQVPSPATDSTDIVFGEGQSGLVRLLAAHDPETSRLSISEILVGYLPAAATQIP